MENMENPKKTEIKNLVLIGLIIITIGMIIYSFGTDFKNAKEQDSEQMVDFVGKLVIGIGMMLTAISLIIIALFTEKYETTIRFGCILVAGILIAFIMLIII